MRSEPRERRLRRSPAIAGLVSEASEYVRGSVAASNCRPGRDCRAPNARGQASPSPRHRFPTEPRPLAHDIADAPT